ncbi:hypothetical protein SASPL_107552 [Salvia splendens]|uniref:Uncharacterized protein n=1 Tax=Salvia splendens TaxID=180675 RepID=A0A8X8YBC6_SALSN|nr:hypothetical protein SASPL_107552 [Salvia splendens]
MERNRDLSEASITLDSSQALMIPIMSSCSLLFMFYLFSSVSQLLTAFTAVASASALYFCLSPYTAQVKSYFGLPDPYVSRCCANSLTRIQSILLLVRVSLVVAWLVTGHWVLNNLLGISLCIAFRFFGANVMVSVATQQASKPVHTVANSLNLPGLQLITRKLELPVKIVFPRNMLGSSLPANNTSDYMMLGLGDMVPCTLGPIIILSWMNKDLAELWEGTMGNPNEKAHLTGV